MLKDYCRYGLYVWIFKRVAKASQYMFSADVVNDVPTDFEGGVLKMLINKMNKKYLLNNTTYARLTTVLVFPFFFRFNQ